MSERTITIQVPVTLPWFDETKWEYVPFVKGSNFEKDWRLWNAHASGWTETQLEGVRSNHLCHMLKPIPAPVTPEQQIEQRAKEIGNRPAFPQPFVVTDNSGFNELGSWSERTGMSYWEYAELQFICASIAGGHDFKPSQVEQDVDAWLWAIAKRELGR